MIGLVLVEGERVLASGFGKVRSLGVIISGDCGLASESATSVGERAEETGRRRSNQQLPGEERHR